ncbi:ATP-binding cassette domain-containing protein [Streptomonospora salina]|uniref:Oleandomycin transport system ATP-binding protein n=1 Tax=Streptomonospora salina TaxID=104205 RepID=A0A841EBZ9_9ACTN|nr:ATP-binding cassette domain-containing protein [Streptomonospora salina]MBB5999944.1 oleandomycin transport system ATP-binding protein [Streptomonospora salina]
MHTCIQAEGLVKRFGETTALDGVDLEAPAGAILGVLGPNGAGKTTTVRILATLARPDTGSVRVAGYDALRDPAAVRSLIGLTGQYASVDEELTGRENLELVGQLLRMPRREWKARARELVRRFDLEEAGERRVKTYSGGMRRRIDLASSLVGRPRVLFLDEPTTGVDPRSRGDLWRIVRELADEGTTVLLTTQYLAEADELADRITVIDHGRVVAGGSPQELKRTTGSQTLNVRTVDPADTDRVVGIVTELVGTGAVLGPDGTTISAPTDDPVLLSALVRRLDQEAIATDELALRLPSLDDVFLSLTGRPRPHEVAPVPSSAERSRHDSPGAAEGTPA